MENTVQNNEQGYALLIGVEEYVNYPQRRLYAGRNDVLALWRLCRRLGYKPENIRVRTSPSIDKSAILEAEVDLAMLQAKGPERGKLRSQFEAEVKAALAPLDEAAWAAILGTATHDGLQAAVGWLSEQLANKASTGILAYSGHGARVGDDLALCPDDVAPSSAGDLSNALKFGDLQRQLQGKIEQLTVVLDCCFAAQAEADDASGRVTSLTAPHAGGATPNVIGMLGKRVFCAAGADENAYQAILGGQWHGAFTWALTRALEQWKMAPSKHGTISTMSQAELLFRARTLLEALSFKQHPVLLDELSSAPVFWFGNPDGEPVDGDAEGAGVLLDPSTKDYACYEIWSFDEQRGQQKEKLAQIIRANKPQGGFEADKAYWYIQGSSLDTDALLNDTTGLMLTKQARAWTDPPSLSADQASFVIDGDSGQDVSSTEEIKRRGEVWAWDYQDTAGHWALRAQVSRDDKSKWNGSIYWLSQQSPRLFKGEGYRYASRADAGQLTGAWKLSHQPVGGEVCAPEERPDTNTEPTEDRPTIQIDPTQLCAVYTMTLNTNETACVLAVAPGKDAYVKEWDFKFAGDPKMGGEYWWLPTSFLNALSSANSITFGAAQPSNDGNPFSSLRGAGVSDPRAAMPKYCDANWRDPTRTAPDVQFYAQGTNRVWYGIRIASVDGKPSVFWFACAMQAPEAHVVGTNGLTFTRQSAPQLPDGYLWYVSA